MIVNTGDDVTMHGLRLARRRLGHVLARRRLRPRTRVGRRDETFRATEELRAFDPDMAWFNLGDLDLATHTCSARTCSPGRHAVGGDRARRGAVRGRGSPAADERRPVETRLTVAADGDELDLPLPGVLGPARARRGEVDPVRGADRSRPAPGVVDAIADADAIVVCPSNPVASIGPILAVPGTGSALASRREDVVGISGIVEARRSRDGRTGSCPSPASR